MSLTPILDLVEPPPSNQNTEPGRRDVKRSDFIILFAIFVFFFAMTLVILNTEVLIPQVFSRVYPDIKVVLNAIDQSPLIALLSLLFSIPLIIVLHEIGHVLFGRLVGMPFHALMIGPLTIDRRTGKLSIRIGPRIGMDGMALVGLECISGLHRRFRVMVIGGIFVNVLSGVAAIVAASVAEQPIKMVLYIFGVFSACIGFWNLVPSRVAGFRTDGALLRETFSARRWRDYLTLAAIEIARQRGDIWIKEKWIPFLSSLQEGTIECVAGSLRLYAWYVKKVQVREAALHLEKCLRNSAISGQGLHDFIFAEATYFTGWWRNDREAAQQWERRIRHRKKLLPLTDLRLRIVSACSRHDFEEALMLWEQGPGIIRNSPESQPPEPYIAEWNSWEPKIRERESLHSSV